MITAIIRNKENTLVLELPHSIYDIYEKLQSIGIMQPPKQIPLIDNEDEDIGVKLFSESDFGQHLLLTLNEKNTIADANMLTLVIGAASEDIKEELEQNILYDQYGSMDEVISAVRQMTQDAGPVKAVFFCPLVGNIDEGDGDIFRHTKAMHLVQAGVDMIYIRDFLGHTMMETTNIYARINIEQMRDALERAYPELNATDLPDWTSDVALMGFLNSL